jgi:lysophospholipase L1-like esterase
MKTKLLEHLPKLILFLLAIFLAFAVVEVSLRLYVSFLNSEKNYRHFSKLIQAGKEEDIALLQGYDRDGTRELYRGSSAEKVKILAVGDSFTNGGNLNYQHSYPYKLFGLLKRAYTVTNLGVCGSTSEDVYFTLRKYFERNRQNQKYLVILLTGATDFFSKKFSSENKKINPMLLDQRTESESKIYHAAGYQLINRIKSLSLLYYFWNKLTGKFEKLRINTAIKGLHKFLTESDGEKLRQCMNSSLLNQADCVPEFISRDYLSKSEKRMMTLIYFNRFLSFEIRLDAKAYTVQLKAIRNFYIHTGQFLKEDDLTEIMSNMLFLYQYQSEINHKQIISYLKEMERKHPQNFRNNELMQMFRENFIFWKGQNKKLRSGRIENLRKVKNLVNENGGRLVVVTYPIPYQDVNQDIRKFSNMSDVPIVDLEEVFRREKISSPDVRLIEDGEHCSPVGYSLMSRKIFELLKKESLLK